MKNSIISIFVFVLFVPHAQAQTVKRILIIGDSLTEGYGVAKSSSYPSQLEAIIEKKHGPVKIINAGSSGSTTASAPKRMKWHLKVKPDIVILALGANDGLRGFPLKSSRENLQKAIDIAKEKKVKIYLAGMKLPMNYGKQYRSDFEKIYEELAKKNKLAMIPFLLKGVGGVKEHNISDGIHPNEKGHKIIAETVYQSIKGDL